MWAAAELNGCSQTGQWLHKCAADDRDIGNERPPGAGVRARFHVKSTDF
jgi:hypothetical protein